MGNTHKHTFGSDFKRFFGRGLAILLPSVLTLWILYQLFMFVLNNVGAPINTGIRIVVVEAAPLMWSEAELPRVFQVTDEDLARERASLNRPGVERLSDDVLRERLRRQQFARWWQDTPGMDLIGLVVAVVVIYFSGLLLGGFLGRKLYMRIEQLIAKMPGFKQLYPHVKKVVEMIFGESATMKAFTEVVIVEYPRKGIWTIGLVTGTAFQEVRDAAGGEVATVFIPTSPTPMTGFVINCRREDVRRVQITVEEALRFVISAGVLTPDSEQGRVSPTSVLGNVTQQSLEASEAPQRATERK
jgi:uncharacterized membrane protein